VFGFTFRETTFRKKNTENVKHFPGNQTKFFFDWKVFSVDRKIFPLTGKCFPLTNFHNGKQTQKSLESGFPESEFRETNMAFGCVCFPESGFRKITFQTFLCLFAIRKVGQWKTLFSQRKIWLGFQESVFLKNLGGKHFPEVVKNLEMSLFADYIKFDPQTFNCYI
jgi:hypothetical protein